MGLVNCAKCGAQIPIDQATPVQLQEETGRTSGSFHISSRTVGYRGGSRKYKNTTRYYCAECRPKSSLGGCLGFVALVLGGLMLIGMFFGGPTDSPSSDEAGQLGPKTESVAPEASEQDVN